MLPSFLIGEEINDQRGKVTHPRSPSKQAAQWGPELSSACYQSPFLSVPMPSRLPLPFYRPHTGEPPPTLGISPLAPDKESCSLGTSDWGSCSVCIGWGELFPPRWGFACWARSQTTVNQMERLTLTPQSGARHPKYPVCFRLFLGLTFFICAGDGGCWPRWSLGPFLC